MGHSRSSPRKGVNIVTAAGPGIGLGHLQRCLTLAQALREGGLEVLFWLRGGREAATRIHSSGFPLRLVDSPSNVLREVPQVSGPFIIDDYNWLTADITRLANVRRPICVVDDLATRKLPVDLVVNGCLHAEQLTYTVGPQTRLLLGAQYVLLRLAYRETPERAIRPTVERLLLTVGGGDPLGITAELITYVRRALPSALIDVVVGPLFPDPLRFLLSSIAAHDPNVLLHQDPAYMRDLMLGADLALSAAGQTLYELAASGTPTLSLLMAENQRSSGEAFQQEGAALLLGAPGDLSFSDRLVEALKALNADPGERGRVSARARSLVDGDGAQRVATTILGMAA